MPAMVALNVAVIFWASSLASQLLQCFVLGVEAWAPRTCRSRLAGDGVFEHCVDLSGLIAGKPAPTMVCVGRGGAVAADLYEPACRRRRLRILR
ncbi:hypothetical protein EMIT0P218_210027 [Pseudomonas sp. IT-P218]